MVRPAAQSDAEVVARLLAQLGYPATEATVRARLAQLTQDDRVLLSEDGSGLIALHRINRIAEGDPLLRITALVVEAAARGRGVGRALLSEAESLARQWGCRQLEVSSGRKPGREAAHRFYPAEGFADAASHHVFYLKTLGG